VAEWTKGLDSEFIVYGQQTGGSTGSTGTTGTKNTQSDGRATYHIFPQLAYGTFTDGSFYQSMLYINNPVGGSTANKLRILAARVFQPRQNPGLN